MAKAHTDKTGIIHVIFVRNCKRADSKRTPEAKREDKRRKDMRRFKNENRGKY